MVHSIRRTTLICSPLHCWLSLSYIRRSAAFARCNAILGSALFILWGTPFIYDFESFNKFSAIFLLTLELLYDFLMLDISLSYYNALRKKRTGWERRKLKELYAVDDSIQDAPPLIDRSDNQPISGADSDLEEITIPLHAENKHPYYVAKPHRAKWEFLWWLLLFSKLP